MKGLGSNAPRKPFDLVAIAERLCVAFQVLREREEEGATTEPWLISLVILQTLPFN